MKKTLALMKVSGGRPENAHSSVSFTFSFDVTIFGLTDGNESTGWTNVLQSRESISTRPRLMERNAAHLESLLVSGGTSCRNYSSVRSYTIAHILDRFDELLGIRMIFEIDEFAVQLDYHS